MRFCRQAVLKAKLPLTAIHSEEQREADAFTYMQCLVGVS